MLSRGLKAKTMIAKQKSSGNSQLVVLLMSSVPVSQGDTPQSVIEQLTTALRRKSPRPSGPVAQLEPFLVARNVVDLDLRPGLQCDGYLQARGRSYPEGFRMVVKQDTCAERVRFTIAHELCHTFFYEFVPEIKFRVHPTDNQEETLCNLGAASFLMPARGLRSRADKMAVSLESLYALAEEYGVSFPSMFLRLRSLGIWKGELSLWRRLCDGTFDLQRLYGGRKISWRWLDNSIPSSAWNDNRVVTGNSFVECNNRQGSRCFEPVWYQLARRGEMLVGLWGSLTPRIRQRDLPLFDAA